MISHLSLLATLSLWTIKLFFYSYHWNNTHCCCCHCGVPLLVLPQDVETKTPMCILFWWSQKWKGNNWCEPLEYGCTQLHVYIVQKSSGDSSYPWNAFSKNRECPLSFWFIALLVCRILRIHQFQLAQYKCPQLLAKIHQHLCLATIWCLSGHLYRANYMLCLILLILQRTQKQPNHHRSLW